MFSRIWTGNYTKDCLEETKRLRGELKQAETILIGAGSGLSASAGFTYSGERFQEHFGDFAEKYGIRDMYSGGFYPFSSLEEYWAWWSRQIYLNRYVDAPNPVYQELLNLVKEKDYFVLTTNVDHCFQKAGFDKKRLFYTQGDYGLWQCSKPCHQGTYDNRETVLKMVKEQKDMRIPTELIPRCPKCGSPMTMNLRCDDTFVEDEGWHQASERYSQFLRRHQNTRMLLLDLGTGMNTPGIVKYSFWRMTHDWPDATYACLNYGEAYAPDEIKRKSICVNGDIGDILTALEAQ